ILDRYRANADIHLGGLPMIVTDMLTYIMRDVVVFGSGILLILIVLLSVFFGRPRWVVLSLMCCGVSVAVVMGMLGFVDWRVTVVSSNFVALLLIFSLSLTVHLIVRYRELQVLQPEAEQRWLVSTTIADKFKPCFYTALTTMVGFASLLVSGIRPVIDFGWMMVIGMVVVFIVAFILFPATLMLLQPALPRKHRDYTSIVTGALARLVQNHSYAVLISFTLVLALSVVGISKLRVENRFIDYFKESTEIYRGMVVIDRELGGTTPMEVIIDADPSFFAEVPSTVDAEADAEFGEDFEDEFSDEFADEEGGQVDLGATSYWYNTFRLQTVEEVHDYLDGLQETGKVLSMATTIRTLQILNQDEQPGTFFLSLLYNRLPEDVKSALFDPYMSADGNQMRFSIRVYDSDPNLRRDKLIREVRRFIVDEVGLDESRVHVTGMLVLYNNVLQSLFRSQILTIGVVFVAILAMYLLLFRSFRIAVIALAPSGFAAALVLGSMGWLGIPLDIMTITIAAISIGIGVDDSIHYVHRFREELRVDGDFLAAVRRCHLSIGRAIYYTSVIITAGFSILSLSNFIPTISFGLLTGLAMVLALVANLTLLPVLLVRANAR
ncbi:MAG: efflux RND transporter permease subunit, partial [Gammaproteobacteria bacterium]